jgi:hypothetical protein
VGRYLVKDSSCGWLTDENTIAKGVILDVIILFVVEYCFWKENNTVGILRAILIEEHAKRIRRVNIKGVFTCTVLL